MRGLVLAASSGTGNVDQLTEICVPNHREYAALHNYDYLVERAAIDYSRPFPWSKVLCVKKHLPNYDFVFWLDTDCLITNMKINIADLLQGCDMVTSLFLIGPGYSGYPYNLHTGCWLVRNTPWSMSFLDEIYDQEDIIQKGDFEEAVITRKYRSSIDYRQKIKVVSLSKLCSPYWQHKEDEFAVHFCRLPHEKKVRYMRNFLSGNREIDYEDKITTKVF
jgi:hypothetical protein